MLEVGRSWADCEWCGGGATDWLIEDAMEVVGVSIAFERWRRRDLAKSGMGKSKFKCQHGTLFFLSCYGQPARDNTPPRVVHSIDSDLFTLLLQSDQRQQNVKLLTTDALFPAF